MSETSRRRSRRSTPRRETARFQQLPWRQVVNPYKPVEVISADELESIHQASLRILEEIGIDFLLPRALEMLKAAGCEVAPGSERVRFDRAMVEEYLAHIPESFTLHARNPERHLQMGKNHLNFAAVASAPNVSDRVGGRRVGNFKDFCELLKLSQSLNIIHLMSGYQVEPVDLPPETRHLDAVQAIIHHSDKVFRGSALGATRILDAMHMARVARGISQEQFEGEPTIYSVINTSSPLRIDGPMLEGVIELASQGQVPVITPFTLAGAMAPVTLAGALSLQNAEALAGLVFTQVVKRGAPVIYGGFTSNVDMKSGAPAFGTPEYTRAALITGQLARRYKVPFRSSNGTAANTLDAQAAYESMMSLWGAVMGHVNLLHQGAGWMEGGLCASYEKMIMDADLLQMMSEFLQPLDFSEDAFGFEAIKEVGAGGHFFGTSHTLARYESAFYAPILSDWRNFETWQEAGSPTTYEHANRVYQQILAEYQPPPLDPAIKDEIADFVARRKAEGGVLSQ